MQVNIFKPFSLTLILVSVAFTSFSQFPIIWKKDHDKAIISAIFAPNGETISCLTANKTIKIYKTATGELVKTLDDKSEGDVSISYSQDSKFLATSNWDKTIKIWDVEKSVITKRLSGHSQATRCVSFSSDGNFIASAGWDDVIKIWYVPTGLNLKNLSGHNQCVRTLSYSPNNKLIASSGYDLQLKVWDVCNGTEVFSVKAGNFPIETLCFSPDGKYVATGGLENNIKIWNTSNGVLIKSLKGKFDDVFSLDYSPDGKYIATASNDKVVRIWDVDKSTCIYSLTDHELGVRSVKFSPNGKYLLTGAVDKKIILYDVSLLNILPIEKNKAITNIKTNPIKWLSPSSAFLTTFSNHLNIKAEISDTSFNNVHLYINKKEFTHLVNNEVEVVKPKIEKYNGKATVAYDLYINNYENEIQIYAENNDRKYFVVSNSIKINYFDLSEYSKSNKLKLWFISPNSYNIKKTSTNYENDNTDKLTGIIKSQEGKLYHSVETIFDTSKTITNNLIVQKADSISLELKKNDIYIIYISGIFLKDINNDIFFLSPISTNKKNELISLSELLKTLDKNQAYCGIILNSSFNTNKIPDNYYPTNEADINNKLSIYLANKKKYSLINYNNPTNNQLADIIANSFHPNNDVDLNNYIDFNEIDSFIKQLSKIYYQNKGELAPIFLEKE